MTAAPHTEHSLFDGPAADASRAPVSATVAAMDAVGEQLPEVSKCFGKKPTLLYRILLRFARRGRIVSDAINKQGASDWTVQRSSGQRIRQCRELGFTVNTQREPYTWADAAGREQRSMRTVWRMDARDQERARKVVAESDRRTAARCRACPRRRDCRFAAN